MKELLTNLKGIIEMGFKFNLRDAVTIAASGETGEVIGRAEYADGSNQYYIRYKAADGRATESWWSESAITA
ncbi:hypothetical protein K6Y74_12650 [Burkholderia cenocepacia]|uniref:hypothetical protein n=1 Tax=Burkholderia cenocepacia TaxID=95486 RepID=UPI002231764E|nr:hypothetical protein [Burkholderia cenocepacia]MCW3644081.1 hypothetical protein [Burkholderia cenocepacia]